MTACGWLLNRRDPEVSHQSVGHRRVNEDVTAGMVEELDRAAL
jgi:hypothetical protein